MPYPHIDPSRSTTVLPLSWRLALVGLGMGLFSGPNQATIMNLAPRDALATAGAATALTRSLGFALGPPLSTLIWAASGYSAVGLSMALVLPVTMATTAGITLGASSLLSRWHHGHPTQPTSVEMASTPVRSEK